MRGTSRVAQPVSPRQKLDPAPSPDYPARPTRLRCRKWPQSTTSSGFNDVEFDEVLEDIGFNYTAPFTEITFPRKGLWLVQAQFVPTNDGEMAIFVETSATGLFEDWFQFSGDDAAHFPLITGGGAGNFNFAQFHIDIPAGNTVTFKVRVFMASASGGNSCDVNLSMERISYGGTTALVT